MTLFFVGLACGLVGFAAGIVLGVALSIEFLKEAKRSLDIDLVAESSGQGES